MSSEGPPSDAIMRVLKAALDGFQLHEHRSVTMVEDTDGTVCAIVTGDGDLTIAHIFEGEVNKVYLGSPRAIVALGAAVNQLLARRSDLS